MKVLFVGPSLYGTAADLTGMEVRGPATFGDVAQAVVDGATAIGIIDGGFESLASVWHKEILFALASGIRVLGAASMGALRAAECARFGMEPIGRVAKAYLSGELDDDAAVAQIHGPRELGYPPITETLVDALSTIDAMSERGVIGKSVACELASSARALFFKDRTVEAMVDRLAGSIDKVAFAQAYRSNIHRIKSVDALELVERLKRIDTTRPLGGRDWVFMESRFWAMTWGQRLAQTQVS